MAQLSVTMPDQLAERCRSFGPWMPTVIELSLVGFKTLAAASNEVIEFLSGAPSLEEITDFHVSENVQLRMRRLLALNEAELITSKEKEELDELQRLEHIVTMLKIQAMKQRNSDA